MIAGQEEERSLPKNEIKKAITQQEVDAKRPHRAGFSRYNPDQKATVTRYQFLDEEIKGGSSTCQGVRSAQEDRSQAVEIPRINEFTQNQLISAFRDTLMKLGEDCAEKRPGSTFSGFVYAPYLKTLIAGNVGDSRTVFIYRDKFGKLHCQRMTWDHKPSDKEEQTRIRSVGGLVRNTRGGGDRLNGWLAVARAFGDQGVGKGLIFTPSMSWKTFEEGEELLMAISGSDGAFDVLGEKEVLQLYNENKDPVKLANKIRHEAYGRGSKDNITAVAVSFAKKMTNGVGAGVDDGHGGHETSEYIRQNFANELGKSLDQFKPAGTTTESKPTDPLLLAALSKSTVSIPNTQVKYAELSINKQSCVGFFFAILVLTAVAGLIMQYAAGNDECKKNQDCFDKFNIFHYLGLISDPMLRSAAGILSYAFVAGLFGAGYSAARQFSRNQKNKPPVEELPSLEASASGGDTGSEGVDFYRQNP